MAKKSKSEMLDTLRALLRESLRLRSEGALHAKLTRASGAVDGYTRALLELGLVDDREVLALIAQERAAFAGPATTTLAGEDTRANLAA